MNYHFYSPLHYEKWDWRSPDDPGIGGSETAVAELARRLAQRGHAVTVYAPLRNDCPPVDPGGARWLPLDQVDFTARGFWVLSRCPADIDKFTEDHPFQKLWLVCQDAAYPAQSQWGLTHERAAKLDICIALCTDHAQSILREYPELKTKIGLSSNGFKLELAEAIEASGPIERDPFKIVYTSSPDRGLLNLLKIFARAREFEPRLTLSAAYGFNNLEKCEPDEQQTRYRNSCETLMKQDGVTWLGRMGQEQLYREFLSAGIWCYPTYFTETSCVTCMEAQALGAIPITNPIWALKDNVQHGFYIQGDPAKDLFCRAEYVARLVKLARDAATQNRLRREMMPWARDKFTWETIATQYEHFAHDIWGNQMEFQVRHGNGRVLNIGSNRDFPGFGKRGGVNLDLCEVDPCGWDNLVDVVADCRLPLPFSAESFDSVIMGEILEHFTDDDAVAALTNAKAVLSPGGHIVLTVPDDHRAPEDQGDKLGLMYDDHTPGFHKRRIPLELIQEWLRAAGLEAKHVETIAYDFPGYESFTGHGVLAC
ncbi:MAG: methyltransferase domain-containing protein [Isosphaeraceae bacterium]